MSIILLVIVLAIYLYLLRIKGNESNWAIQIVQGIMWSLIAMDNWNATQRFIQIVYIILILFSFISGIKYFYENRKNNF